MKTILFVATMALALLETSALADQDAGKKPTKADDDVICRTEAEIGSRLNRKRICRTRAQWEEQRREDRRSLEKVQNTRMVTGR